MDDIQFKRLQKAVQWAYDQETGVTKTDLAWYQGDWFRGALDGVVPHDERYHFVDVTCGSSGCIAGNVVIAEGDKMVIPSAVTRSVYKGMMLTTTQCLTTDGEVTSIPARARDLLGITQREADSLFAGDNTIDAVIRRAKNIAKHYGHRLVVKKNKRKQVVNA